MKIDHCKKENSHYPDHAKGVLLLVIVAIMACAKKDESPIVARAGDAKITVDEFRKRFALNPRLLQYQDHNHAKLRFLGSLIAEKLLASEAEHEGFTLSPRTPAFLAQINREAVVEEFYNEKAAAKVHLEEKELRQAYEKQRRVLHVQYTSFKSLRDAQAFREQVLSGQSFEMARSKISAPLAHAGAEVDTMSVKWGAAESHIEDALYQLAPGEVSKPLPALDEFYIARILSATVEDLGTEQDFVAKREKIERILKKKKTTAIFMEYFRQIMTGRKTSVPPRRLKYVAESLERSFSIGQDGDSYLRARNPSPIHDAELDRAQQGLHASMNEILATFDDGTTWTIKEFLQRLSVGRYNLDFSSVKSFRLSLREAIITMIEQEYVFKEAVREDLHNSSFVLAELRMWRENVMAQEYVQKLLLLNQPNHDIQESLPLTDEQLAALDNKLATLLEIYDVDIDLKTLNEVEVKNAGLLAFKTHFPGRLVVPVPLPLENLAGWQEKVQAMVK